ncbi:cytochrome C peroxidase [Chryseobacterium aquaticum]|uniref:Cytochrome C peroxidase n=1 Tax=Chryseobacterium aquaticum TaxID=452084 RepID=A0A0Q3KQL8_9FLAO|nr:cytochrome c peroxidase [Chryseobacterium aquaticum]KQK26532.1 cytochrome C peroxidase [Chryseobacterium aquaticum]
MKKTIKTLFVPVLAFAAFLYSCSGDDVYEGTQISSEDYPNILATFGSNINLSSLENYANQTKPNYITRDNSTGNPITDKGATLGRMLFYDKNLSKNNTISCSSCHKQELAFGDNIVASVGVNGTTGRHSMRLVNARFGNEAKFFWDERATTLEAQTTFPIQDHIEMGFSGTNGDGNLQDLITKLQNIKYYQEMFKFVYGDATVNQTRIQNALAQFIRSIQSFDSKYDAGRAASPNDQQPFANFTAQENQGKNLFLAPPQFGVNGNRTGGGLGCAACHAAPEFDIDPNSKNNGIIGKISGTGIDITNTRAPSLRNITNNVGIENGQFMHTGNLTTLQQVIGHYANINIAPGNTNLDPRLTPGGVGQKLNLTAQETDAVIAFLKTLSGSDVYTNKKWSNPFK